MLQTEVRTPLLTNFHSKHIQSEGHEERVEAFFLIESETYICST